MEIKAKFIPWLLHQIHRNDPVGDLARDVQQDRTDRVNWEEWVKRQQKCGCFPRCCQDCSTYLPAFLDGEGGPELSWSWKDLYLRVRDLNGCHGARVAVLRAARAWYTDSTLTFETPPDSAGVYCVSYVALPDLVKIGRSRNIRKRIESFATGAPGGVVLRAILSLDPDDEKSFHRQFAEHHFDGEWFSSKLLSELP